MNRKHHSAAETKQKMKIFGATDSFTRVLDTVVPRRVRSESSVISCDRKTFVHDGGDCCTKIRI